MRNLCLLLSIVILFLGAKESEYTTTYTATIDPMIAVVVSPPKPLFYKMKGRIPDFLKKHYHIAKKVEKSTGVPKDLILAVGAHESNWGKSSLSRRYNNYFGRKAYGREPYAIFNTFEFKKGKYYKVKAKFKTYKSIEDSFRDFAKLITSNKRYSRLRSLPVDKVDLWAKRLQESGYATDPEYSYKLTITISKFKKLIE